MRSARTLEFLWNGLQDGPNTTSVLAHVLDTHYSTPDIGGSTPAEKAANFAAALRARAESECQKMMK